MGAGGDVIRSTSFRSSSSGVEDINIYIRKRVRKKEKGTEIRESDTIKEKEEHVESHSDSETEDPSHKDMRHFMIQVVL